MEGRTLIKICVTALMALAVLYVIGHWQKWSQPIMGPDGEELPNNAAVINKLLACLGLAIVGGIFFVLVILPKFGDAVSTMMTGSGEEVRADESSRAAAKLAQGDYEGAIEEYQKVIKEKPDDPHPVSEIAKIQAEKLESPAAALTFLKEHLEDREWSEENAAFLMFRMADIYQDTRDFDSAKEILTQVAGTFPNTRHSANARHKINELEQAQFKDLQSRRSQGGGRA